MRKRRVIGALIFAIPVALAAATFAVAGDGGKNRFKADTLTGYQEAAPISTTGTGSFEASLNGAGDEISYTLTYGDLEGVANNGVVAQAHIHFGQRGVSGGVIAFLCGGSTKPACPASPATVTGTITAADVIGPTGQGIEPASFAEAVRAIRAGMVYANVHTTRWPSGEIRGQVNDKDQRDGD